MTLLSSPAVETAFVMTVSFTYTHTHTVSDQRGGDTKFVSRSGVRTALLDSDQHTCPTCKQSNVSPDTLIANKFLRQVNDHTTIRFNEWRMK